MRVVVLSVHPPLVARLTGAVRALGHDVVAVVAPRLGHFAHGLVDESPGDLDLVLADAPTSLARILRAYDPDVGLCSGFPWRITPEAIDAPRLGIVNGHPSMLPSYRGPIPMAWAVRNGEDEIGLTFHFMDASFDTGNVLAQVAIPLDPEETMASLEVKLDAATSRLLPLVFERLAAGDEGEPQQGGSYYGRFEEEYARVDLTRTAAEVHTQVRAWSFVPPRLRSGPLVERDGARLRLDRTSLSEVEGAERLDCADGPLWVLESTPL